MQLTEILKLSLTMIWAHRLRSALTLLGMVLGVTAVIVVVSVIQGFNTYVDEKIAGIGSKSFSIFRFDFFEDFKDTDTIAEAQRRNKYLTLEDFDYLRDHSTLIDALGAKAFPSTSQIKRGAEILEDVAVDGATMGVARIENTEIANGRFFTEIEDETARRVAFIGADVDLKLFGSETAVGQEIVLAGLPYRVIGTAAVKGSVFGIPQDLFVTIPLRSYARDFGPLVGQRSLYFVGTAISDQLFPDAVEEARQLMRVRRRLQSGEKDSFGIITPDAITGLRDRIFGPIFIVAIAVPSIALFVGGIVIMNIMLVSVTERTREIGIRKALGARRKDILKQFLIEAITLSSIGGIIGVIAAWLLGLVLSALFFSTHLSLASVIVAVGVSGAVGILSGIFPAWQAARLDPIEALRAE